MNDATLQCSAHCAKINYSTDLPDALSPDELENRSIIKGNLTKAEREIIRHHVVMTYRMLSQLNFPKELKNVPEKLPLRITKSRR